MSHLDAVLARLDANRDAALARLFDFLKIQSISTDPAYTGECRNAAEWVKAELESIGIQAEVKPTGGHPAVTARVDGSSKRHALFYGHYDVQPVDPLNLWDTPPFEPVITSLPDGRKVIRARGSADDKGQIMTFIEACRAYKEVVGELPIGVTFLIEGEEEDGSKHLPAFVEAEKAALKADVALVCDTSMWDRNTPQITSSLRGMVYEELTIKAADRDLHSGLFGGGAQNPIRVLTKILADLHDADVRVTLKDFYDGVPETPSQVLAQWDTLGLTAEEFLGGVGLSEPAGEKGRGLIEMIQSRPTCDVNGIIGGYTGVGALVGDQNPAKIRDAFHAHVHARLPKDCRVEFISHKGSPALALPFDMPDLVAAKTALQEEWGVAPVTLGSGGSIPIVGDFKRILGLDTLLIGFGLDDDRIHSPNEKYDLTSFEKGARSWARILAALAG